MTVFYCPINRTKGRYVDELITWTLAWCLRHGIPVRVVEGHTFRASTDIQSGVVLDAHDRSYYALTQIAELVRLDAAGEIGPDDCILFDDFFTPGIEALPYIHSVMQRGPGSRPKLYARLHAQSVDQYDFTYPMRPWLRPYELMIAKCLDGIYVSSQLLAELLGAAGFECPVHVTGHIFDRDWVRNMVAPITAFAYRKPRIVWSSRWDTEKQPWFFMDLIEQGDLVKSGYQFEVLSGQQFRSNDPKLVDRARDLEKRGLLRIRDNLDKEIYYRNLAFSRLHFMASLQDWISYTLLEASAVGTPTLAPNFRSFPEVIRNQDQLYRPWDLGDALAKAKHLLLHPPASEVISAPADHHHGSFDRMIASTTKSV